ncbi:MAG TPA: hypothetical protein VFT59_01900 [Candidatus Saccharimonadales bacterium]|nr:hypothetical protein [Candidatus Saccharimonadales bacterium]
MPVGQFALLGRFGALGGLGASIRDNQSAFNNALKLTRKSDSFHPTSLFYATCMDDRPGASRALRMPGGGMTLGFMAQFLWGDKTLHQALERLQDRMGIFSYLHADCLAMHAGVSTVREIMADPTEEVAFLQWLGLDRTLTPDVFIVLGEWAAQQLPDDFIAASTPFLAINEVFMGNHNPVMAVLNKGRRGKTFAYQAEMPPATQGFTAFSLDLWPAKDFASMLAGGYAGRANTAVLEALYLLLCVGFLRRVGSPHLYLDVS